MGTLYYGGTIYTMNQVNETVEAVFEKNGKIEAMGSVREIEAMYQADIDHYHDLQENVMYPGFVDSHLHIIGHGEKLLHLDLSAMQSAEEVLAAVEQKMKELEPDEWLIAEGWNENQWQDSRIIDKSELDAISSERPMMLTRVCRHAIITNSKVLELADITKDTVDPQGGKIVRNQAGEPTGYLLDQAQELVKEIVPMISEKKLQQTVQVAVEDLLRLGLVGGHSEDLFYYGGFQRTLAAYQAILPTMYKFRAHLLVHHLVFDDMLEAGYRFGDGGEYTSLGPMKIFSDGALGGRTAWLKQPYADDEKNSGIPIHTTADLDILFQKVRKWQHPVAVHAIGDQAVEEVARMIKKYPLTNGLRDRIIHAQVMDEDVLALLTELPVVLDIQPSFVASDFPWVIERLGAERAECSYPWKTYLKQGIACAGGSDAPIEDVNPLKGIQAAVTRRSRMDGAIYGGDEELSVFEAISLYTKGSAFVINHEHDRGVIQPGYTADFTILEKDLFYHDPAFFHEIAVNTTIVNGEVMYRKQQV